jgi:hypothetical protein
MCQYIIKVEFIYSMSSLIYYYSIYSETRFYIIIWMNYF